MAVQLLRSLQGAPELRLTCCDLGSQVVTGSQDGASSLRILEAHGRFRPQIHRFQGLESSKSKAVCCFGALRLAVPGPRAWDAILGPSAACGRGVGS